MLSIPTRPLHGLSRERSHQIPDWVGKWIVEPFIETADISKEQDGERLGELMVPIQYPNDNC